MTKQIEVNVAVVENPQTKRLSMVLRQGNGYVRERVYIMPNSQQSKDQARDMLVSIARDKQYRVYDASMDDYNGGFWS